MTEKKLTINELRAGTKSSRALRIGGAAVLIAAVAAGVWYFGFADTAKVPVYRTVEITRGPLEVTVVANGTVNPVRTVSIGSELSGIVRKVNVDVNSIVKAGDVLIELDDSNLKANVNQAKASLASAKGRLPDLELMERVEARGIEKIMTRKRQTIPMCANVDLYSGLIYSMLDIPEDLYTPLFATARIAGWCAHRLEELATGNRIMRPAYRAAVEHRAYVPMEKR